MEKLISKGLTPLIGPRVRGYGQLPMVCHASTWLPESM
jgi:hypothetical protein